MSDANPSGPNLDSAGVRTFLQDKKFNELRRVFKELATADIAESLDDLDSNELVAAFRLVSHRRKTDVFSYLTTEGQQDILRLLPEDAVTVLLNEMEGDDRTTLLESLDDELASKYILQLEPEERRLAWRLLSYPEDSVGRLMSPVFFSVPSGLNISQAIEYIRWNASNYPEESLSQILVVDQREIYKGDISLAALFVCEDTSSIIDSLIQESYVTVSPYEERGSLVDLFRKYDKPSLPVVDHKGRVVGLVTSDDIFDIAEEEATEDIHQFGGTQTLEDSYVETSLFSLLQKRIGWLVVLFFGGLWSAHALKVFEDEIARYAFLIFFLPIIISSGGNSGSQTASLIIRGLAIKELKISDWFFVLRREIVMGGMLGSILAGLGFACAYFWELPVRVGMTVGIALVCAVSFGSICGGMLPFLLKKLGLDPAVSSSPLIASMSDLFGIIVFFELAVRLV